MAARRFPPPWSIEEQAACFVVQDVMELRTEDAQTAPAATTTATADAMISGRKMPIQMSRVSRQSGKGK
jgi:hypothetical protein